MSEEWEVILYILSILALLAAVFFGLTALFRWLDREAIAAQKTCIEAGYIEELYYSTQSRYFCIGLNAGEWSIAPMEQLETD